MNRDQYKHKILMRDVVHDVVEKAWLFDVASSIPKYQKPGEYYMSLGPAKRALLKDLKSDDISDVRWPPYDNTNSSDRKK
jgi:hypothetical protein